MSFIGPPEACVTGITPAAWKSTSISMSKSTRISGKSHIATMNSTTLIPKCSSTIVLSPMLARASQRSISAYGAFTTNSTRV